MKTLTHVDGNLLTHPKIQVIGHQTNCQNIFGSGIARSIKEMYPEAYQADCVAAKNKQNSLGQISRAEVPSIHGIANRYGNQICRIYNLYGQNLGTGPNGNARKTNYEALYSALEKMAGELRATEEDLHMFDYNREPIVGFPFLMGSALGGGNFDIVSRLIEVAFDGYKSDVFIVHFKP